MRHYQIAASMLLTLAAPVASQQVAPNELLIEVSRAYSPAVTAAVAQLGRPSRLMLEPGQTLRGVIVSRCGTFEAVYVAAFLKENGIPAESTDETTLANLPTGVVYAFPACIYSRVIEHKVQPSENPSTIYASIGVPFAATSLQDKNIDQIPKVTKPLKNNIQQFVSGEPDKLNSLVTAARGFDGTEAARVFAVRNADAVPTKLNMSDQSTLYVPSSQRSGIIVLRDGTDIAQAKKTLLDAVNASPADQGAPSPTVAADVGTGNVNDVTLAELIDTVPYNGSCDWKNGSPIALDDLRHGRDENEWLRSGKRRTAKVLVIDTGYDERLKDPAISESKLGSLSAFHVDDDPKHYHGFNPVDQDHYTDPTPPTGWASAMHGGQVAATMLGGRFLQGADRSSIPLEVTFASLAKGKTLRAEGANSAIAFAAEQDINIVNTSFVARSPYQDFVRVLQVSTPPLLVIAAAGNDPGGDGLFSDGDETWPGRLGGEMIFSNTPALILSVGAHGPMKELLSFSRRGREHVDLLAPGCKIPTYTLDDNGLVASADPSGTSFAAPIVTLVAGELYAEGLSPVQIRNRILASVDIDQSLDGKVWSSGTLNVRKALSVYRDLVIYTPVNTPPNAMPPLQVSGTLANSGDRITCGGIQILYGNIMKFSFAGSRADSTAQPKNYIFLKPLGAGGRYLRQASCSVNELQGAKPLKFTDADTGQPVEVELSKVLDFVARSFTPTKMRSSQRMLSELR